MIGCARFEVKASTQCAMASTPVAAVTIGGTETVSAGSMIAMSASISTLSVAILFIVVRVGDECAGADLAAGTGRRRNLHQRDAALRRAVRPRDFRQRSSLATSTATSLARSMALPPPKPITASASAAFAAATAASRFGKSGSGFTSPKSSTSSRPRTSRRAAFTLSATTKGRRTPAASSQGARVSTWPAPKRTIPGRCISIGAFKGQHRVSPQATASRRAFWTSGSGSRPAASRRRV